ncbi:MAG: flagellar basal body rod protein FlgC [Polyangiaceae bacterium UTPRO1]|nr:flagellar basal body rod protein FlgC [Myxococcales bacterium]OQY66415.1 MAG: flagellar basal body rod protein FlgC [Polyangiaceae bacterium UTPRO1]
MDVATTFAISSSALQAQRLRMDVIAANLANAQSTRTPEGGPYKRRDVVLEAMPGGRFDDVLGAQPGGVVRVARIEADAAPPRVVFDPGHPDADAKGYVAYPNVNPMIEMVNLMAATRAYEANVAAVNATKRVLEAALSIGR